MHYFRNSSKFVPVLSASNLFCLSALPHKTFHKGEKIQFEPKAKSICFLIKLISPHIFGLGWYQANFCLFLKMLGNCTPWLESFFWKCLFPYLNCASNFWWLRSAHNILGSKDFKLIFTYFLKCWAPGLIANHSKKIGTN